MRARPEKNRSWYRIENHDTSGDTTTVYIYDEIGGGWFGGVDATEFVQEFAAISTPNIDVHINSPGGQVWDGIAIYNAIKSHPSNVTTIVDALAASAASFIFQAGNTRKITRNATLMIHDGQGMAYGNAEDMRQMADLLDKVSNNIADIYAQASGGTVADWRAMMQAETWYSSQEAVDAKLADEVLNVEDKQAEEATNRWDLSIFAHAGRAAAPSPDEVRKRLATVLNRVKEASVGTTPTNTEQQPAGTGTASEGGTEGTDPTQGTQQQTGAEAAPVEGTPAAPAVTDQATGSGQTSPEPMNLAGSVPLIVNGQSYTVPAPVAQHLSTLENFRDETVRTGRKNFVASLASGPKPKIAASQMNDLEELVLSLSPEQFEKFKASWDAAPALSLLGNFGGGVTNENGTGTPRQKLEEELEIARETVNQHRYANMPQDQIEKTASYQRMLELENQLKQLS